MEFLDPVLDEYVHNHTAVEPQLLADLNRETHLKVMIPRMLSGHLQGRVLSMLSRMIRPQYILEIGTYTGYSALCLAEGLQKGGKLVTIDNNEELKPMLDKYLGPQLKSGVIDLRIGDAMKIIPDLPNGIDLVFIDADKENYSNYFDLVIDKLSPNGFILADNVLWSGKVIKPIEKSDVDTLALDAFNKKVQADMRVENVLLPVRDGLMLIRKK